MTELYQPATNRCAEFDAVAQFTVDNVRPTEIKVDDPLALRLLRVKDDEKWEFHDLAQFAEWPRRAKGTRWVHDAPSFTKLVGALNRTARVYIDEYERQLTAVLNDDELETPGWRDDRVAFQSRRTPEWQTWLAGQGLTEQQTFAERIEDGLPEIVEPAGSVMLEIAQQFQASVASKFAGGQRLATGERQFTFTEDIAASSGQVAIPETFKIGVAPFIGAKRYEVTARLRFRLRNGELAIGYLLVRPDDIERDAFNSVAAEVERVHEGECIRGSAPAPGGV